MSRDSRYLRGLSDTQQIARAAAGIETVRGHKPDPCLARVDLDGLHLGTCETCGCHNPSAIGQPQPERCAGCGGDLMEQRTRLRLEVSGGTFNPWTRASAQKSYRLMRARQQQARHKSRNLRGNK